MSVSRIWGYLRDYRFWAIVGALAFLVAVMLWNPSHDEPRKAAFGDSTAASPTSVPTTSAPPKKPVLPASARHPSDQAAAAFARYAFDIYNYTFESLDTSAMSTLCLPESGWCDVVLDEMKSARESHQFYEAGHITVENTRTIRRNPSQVNVLMSVNAAELRTIQAGKTVGTESPYTGRVQLMLLWQDKEKTWKVFSAAD